MALSYGFLPTLQDLTIWGNSSFAGVAQDKFGTCHHLRFLRLLCLFTISGPAANGGWYMGPQGFANVPNLSCLTQLTALCLDLPKIADDSALDWIWPLTQLRELSLGSKHNMQIGPSLTELSQP